MTWAMIFGLILGAIGVLAASGAAIRYRITPTHLEVRWLIFTLRRFRLDNIRHVSTKRSFWSEKWYNTLRVRNRRLTIRRKSGLIKTVSISPKNPFVFKAELDRAMGRPTNIAEIDVLPQIYPTAPHVGVLELEEKHTG